MTRPEDADRHAAWDPCERLLVAERTLFAARMLRREGVFPGPGDRCLEVGYGRGGWLGQLISWGVRVTDLHGMEIDAVRAEAARRALPGADLRVGDAARMPWPEGHFRLAVASTVFTSILADADRRALAGEIARVVSTGGALLFYDFRIDNPGNERVRRIRRSELARLFPGFAISARSVSLAPPLARRLGRFPRLALALTALPILRTHLLAVMVRKAPGTC